MVFSRLKIQFKCCCVPVTIFSIMSLCMCMLTLISDYKTVLLWLISLNEFRGVDFYSLLVPGTLLKCTR